MPKSGSNKQSSGKVTPVNKREAPGSTPRAAGKKEPTNGKRKPAPSRPADAASKTDPLPAKLLPPRLGRLYARERLFGLLDRMRADHRVIWVSAPGGAGKTSLAVSYLQSRELPVLWYQADQGDGDIASFFYYMRLAAQQAAPRYKTPLPLFTPEYLGDVPTFTRNFFRELYRRLPGNCVLVLDNYQDVPESSLLHDVLHTAMNEMPEGIRLFVLSRAEPPAMLARLRLCDHAACLGWDTIQLTREETAGLARLRIGRELPDAGSIDALHVRTDGWAAGVVLMLEQSRNAEGLDTASLPTDQKLLFDYFAGEVLSRNEPQVREFLLKTALLPTIRADDARVLTGIETSRDILDDLTRRNYFTVRLTGSDGDTYQFHPLFRVFLLAKARETWVPAELARQRHRAATLLEQSGRAEDALALYLDAGDEGNATRLILQHAPMIATQGRLLTLGEMIMRLPAADRESQPWLMFWFGACRLPMDPGAALAPFAAAFERFERDGDAVGAFLAWAGAIDAIAFQMSDFEQFGPWLDRLDRLTAAYPEFPSAEAEARVLGAALLACLWHKPAHPSLDHWLQRAVTLVRLCDDPATGVRLAFNWIIYSFWYGTDGQKIAEMHEYIVSLTGRLADAPLERALIQHAQTSRSATAGDTGSALRAMDRGLEMSARSGVHVMDVMTVGMGAWACLGEGDLARADELLQYIQQRLERFGNQLDHAFYWHMRSWRAALAGDLPTAQHQIALSLQFEETLQAHTTLTYVLLTAAHYHIEQGELNAARAALSRADVLLRDTPKGNLWYMHNIVEAQLAFADDREAEGYQRLGEALRLLRRIGWFNNTMVATAIARLCALALEKNIEPDAARGLIRKLHLMPPDGLPIELEAWPWPVKIHALGRFGLLVDDKPLPHSASHKKPIELLQALIALGGREVDEGRLAEMCWPEAEGDAAAQNLKVNVHRLRKLLPGDALVWSDRKLSLDARRVWVDLWALERELGLLEQAATSVTAQQIIIAQKVLGLCRGDLFPGNTAPWALGTREKLRNKTLRIAGSVADMIARQEPAAAIPVYEKMIQIDPLRETLYQGLMHCHRQLQQPAEALHAYQRCRDILSREMGLTPSPATEALRKPLHPGP